MGLFLSFLGGAAQSFSEELEKSEKEAKNNAILGVKAMTERYKQVAEENRKLKEKLDADKEFILAHHRNATPAQINELLARPTVMEAFKKYKDPSSISLDSIVKISQGNESVSTATQRVAALPDIVERAKAMATPKMQQRTSPLGKVYGEFADRAFKATQEKALMQTAEALGVSVEDLKNQRRLERPTPQGTADMSVFAPKPEEPKSVDDLIKRQELARVQAGQQFGKDSAEYKAAEAAVNETKSYITQTDRSLEVRLDRLSVAAMDEKDPARKKDLQRQIKETQQAIKVNKEATAAKTDAQKEKTYSQIRSSVNDYVNSRMREEEGATWRQYVEYSTMQLPDGSTYTGRTLKKMPVEAQQAMFARERQLTEEALRANGYVAANGMPRYPAVAEIMRNMNVPIGQQQPAPAPAPTATATPAAPATQQRAAAPTKTVKKSQVEAVARSRNVSFEEAAAAARAEGYTITE